MSADRAPSGDGAGPSLSLAEAARLRLLDGGKIRFSRAGSRLDMALEGERSWERVTVRRAFPLSLPAEYFSVRDGENHEIGMLADLNGLDPASRQLVGLELERRYLVAVIRRIVKVSERFGTVDWDAETDRGPCRFTTRDLRESAIRAGGNHYLFTDVENNRFEIPDLDALDAQSQEWLIRHL